MNTIDYRNTGIILRVSPRININGNVRLEVEQEISNAEAAANRYMRAFEQGELDAKTCANRTNAIQVKLGLLRNRREDLKHLIEQMPGKPSAKAVAQIRRALKHVFAHGTAAQRKAMIEATVAEIRFEGTSLIPVFKVPEEATRPVAKTGLSGEVRAMEPVVRRQGDTEVPEPSKVRPRPGGQVS